MTITITDEQNKIIGTIEIIKGKRPDENNIFDDNIYSGDDKKSKKEAIFEILEDII